MQEKNTTREEIAAKVAAWRNEGKIVGFTSGAFDILHAGHVAYLEEAKKRCDILIVGVNTDESIKEYKDPLRPIVPVNQRIAVVSGLASVDYVFSFTEPNNNKNISELKPTLYIKAGDYSPETLSSASIVREHGGDVLIVPLEKGLSTTNIIQTIISRFGGVCMPQDQSKAAPGMDATGQKAILIDRDGTINKDIEYLHEPEKFELLPNAGAGLKAFQDLGYKIVVVTLQAGIGLGYFSKEDFYKMNREMFKQLAPFDVTIDKIYFATHGKTEDGKNPKEELFERARQELGLDVAQCVAIGDKTTDLAPGSALGMKTIGVKTGKAVQDSAVDVTPDYVAEDLLDAATWLQAHS